MNSVILIQINTSLNHQSLRVFVIIRHKFVMISIMILINKIKDFILDLVFPRICLACSQESFYLCENCLDKIPLTDKLGCPVCEKITLYGKTCENCQRKTYLTGLLYATSYKNPIIREAIKLLKYKYVKELSEALAKIIIKLIKNSGFLVNNFTEELTSFLIIPVPLHRKKFLSRGFNQSELLAQKLAEEFDLALRTDLLIKTKNTRSQTDLKEERRIINVKDVFEVNPVRTGIFNKIKRFVKALLNNKQANRQKNISSNGVKNKKETRPVRNFSKILYTINKKIPLDSNHTISRRGIISNGVKDKIILLIDDVVTTGSTINEAAKALKKSGAREVWGIALAGG